MFGVESSTSPPADTSRDRLFEIAAGQEGYFTSAQALAADVSPQLLAYQRLQGRVLRVLRGVYRLVQFPPGDHDDLVALWLWSEQQGIFSHETALALHDLSDALPTRAHLTLPAEWKKRRLRIPRILTVYHADVPDSETSWSGTIPLTAPLRTIHDCIASHVSPDLVQQAVEAGIARGLFAAEEVRPVLSSA